MNNFIKKILFGVVRERIEGMFLKLISANQSDYIEKVFLTQKIVIEIRKEGNPSNIVIKLYMTKSQDRVSWFFMMKVLMKMGFHKFEVDLTRRLLANICY